MNNARKQREYVTKNIAAFKVSNIYGGFILMNSTELQRKSISIPLKLESLLNEMEELPFYKKFYYAKDYSTENNLIFEEIPFDKWKNNEY